MLSREKKFEKYNNIHIFDIRSLRQTKNIYPVYQTLTSTFNFNVQPTSIQRYYPSRQIDVESTSIQRRGRRRNDVDFRSKTQIESTIDLSTSKRRRPNDKMTSKRRRQNDVETTSISGRKCKSNRR